MAVFSEGGGGEGLSECCESCEGGGGAVDAGTWESLGLLGKGVSLTGNDLCEREGGSVRVRRRGEGILLSTTHY